MIQNSFVVLKASSAPVIEPRDEKICLRAWRPGKTQIGLLNYTLRFWIQHEQVEEIVIFTNVSKSSNCYYIY